MSRTIFVYPEKHFVSPKKTLYPKKRLLYPIKRLLYPRKGLLYPKKSASPTRELWLTQRWAPSVEIGPTPISGRCQGTSSLVPCCVAPYPEQIWYQDDSPLPHLPSALLCLAGWWTKQCTPFDLFIADVLPPSPTRLGSDQRLEDWCVDGPLTNPLPGSPTMSGRRLSGPHGHYQSVLHQPQTHYSNPRDHMRGSSSEEIPARTP